MSVQSVARQHTLVTVMLYLMQKAMNTNGGLQM